MIPPAALEYVSDRDGGFKRTLERCKLLTRCAFEYFDQTSKVRMLGLTPDPAIAPSQLRLVEWPSASTLEWTR